MNDFELAFNKTTKKMDIQETDVGVCLSTVFCSKFNFIVDVFFVKYLLQV